MSEKTPFDQWFAASKYTQVVFPEHHWYQIAKDAYEKGYKQAAEDAVGICERFDDRSMRPAECADAIRLMAGLE